MNKLEQLYEGKAKKVFATEDPALCIVSYKDDATAFNGQKRGTIAGKGAINNRLTNYFMQLLEGKGIPTHFVEEISERETVVRKVTIVPLEVIVRNVAAGSLSKRLGIPEGTPMRRPVIEYCYKCDELDDPMVNEYHIAAMEWATELQMKQIAEYALKINSVLLRYFRDIDVNLIDFKLEFGRMPDGTIILADEISPDTCRLWDEATGDRLDKDRFRLDLSRVVESYTKVLTRLTQAIGQ